MYELGRIEEALATKRLDPLVFERCATDTLSEIYPGLSPVPGGADWGRDADIHGLGAGPPPEVLITTSRSLDGIRKNLVSGLKSLLANKKPVERVVLAHPADLDQPKRAKLEKKAREFNVTIEAFHGGQFFASRLRRDGYWRKALLGLSGEPITLSGVPSDLAESAWEHLPLIGRDQELATLAASSRDLLVTGCPGVGKTRLVAALDDIVFVDRDAAEGRLADDLRWLRPGRVALDDAGQAIELVRRLVRLRRVEGDLLKYKIVAVCWTDEVDALKDVLPQADVVQVDLMERKDVDSIVRSMGVGSAIARQQILDQAEGRPGWAIALGDMLTKTRKWDTLFNGSVILGEVGKYLRRAGVGAAAIDLLTTVAALGGVHELEVRKVAAALSLSLPEARRLLLNAAHSGLVDTSTAYVGDRRVRRYDVRPPMLADILVAEYAFRADVPAVDLSELATSWPDRIPQLAEAAVDSALLGVIAARPSAQQLVRQTVTADNGPPDRLGLVKRYAQVDQQAGREVLGWIARDLANLSPSERLNGWRLEPIAELASLLALWHRIPEAVQLLFVAAIFDDRPTNPHPRHPLRQLEQLVCESHPELRPPAELRWLVASQAEAWIANHSDSPRAWSVYAEVVSTLLSLRRKGHYQDPGDPNRVIIYETVMAPDEMHEVFDKIWPPIRGRLASAPPGPIKSAIDAASDWLRIGDGRDRPHGRDHPAQSIKAAKRLGRTLLRELRAPAQNHPALALELKNVAQCRGIPLQVKLAKVHQVFLGEVDLREDWERALAEAKAATRAVVQPWAKEDPQTVVRRLVGLKEQVALTGREWPPRLEWACEALAEAAGDLSPWIEASLARGLFPEAGPFIQAAFKRTQPVRIDLVQDCLSKPAARWRLLSAVLPAEIPEETLRLVLWQLEPSDYKFFASSFVRNDVTLERQQRLLTEPSGLVRSAVALGLFEAGDRKSDWPHEEIRPAWLAAIKGLDPSAIPGLDEYSLRRLFEFMAAHYPDELLSIVTNQLQRALDDDSYQLSFDFERLMHLLPSAGKTSVLESFGSSKLRWHLVRYLPGNDAAWIEKMLDRSLMTVNEALASKDGFGPEPSVPELARLLVPRGVDSAAIAWQAQARGMEFGEESTRLGALLEDMEEYARSDDSSVAAVGRAGIEMFTARRDRAVGIERIERIRGEL